MDGENSMSKLDIARERLAAARRGVILAEESLDAAVRRRDEAEEALYRAEEDDLG